MTMARLLRTRLNQTVSVKVVASPKYNAYGDRRLSTAAATTYVARQEPDVHMVKDESGRDVVSMGRCYVGPTSAGTAPSITVRDQVTLPDGTTRQLISVETQRDRSGTHHQVLHY